MVVLDVSNKRWYRYVSCRRQSNPQLATTVRLEIQCSPYLGPHTEELFKIITRKALEASCRPFHLVSLSSMSQSLGLAPVIVEEELVALIEEGRVKGRIDAAEGLYKVERRASGPLALDRLLAAGRSFVTGSRGLALRASLVQHKLVQVRSHFECIQNVMSYGHAPLQAQTLCRCPRKEKDRPCPEHGKARIMLQVSCSDGVYILSR